MAPENDIVIQELLATMQELRLAIAAGLPHSRLQVRRQSQGIDKLLPFEVWEQILSYLYPSQITRLSKVNKAMYEIIAASSLWSKMFRKAFGPDASLYTLPATRESKSYMLYMCAVSTRVCEQCWVHSIPSQHLATISARPLAILVPDILFRLNNRQGPPVKNNGSNRNSRFIGVGQVVDVSPGALAGHRHVIHGEPVNARWTVRMCLPCRQELYLHYDEPVPTNITNQYVSAHSIRTDFRLTQSEIDSLPARRSHYDVEYSVKEAYTLYRHKVGGNAGVAFYSNNNKILWKEQEEQKRTDERIDDYCHM